MEEIITALEKITSNGSFCAKHLTPTDNLQLEVKGFGLLKFSLTAQHSKALIKLAKPAHFGWRNKTLLDKRVRDGWEISKNQIKIQNTLWNKELKSVLELLKDDLGLAETAVLKASLHNLLIYAPGQFFNPHQDSEKQEGMVATLVIVLPSAHNGGELIVNHHGQKKQFQTSTAPLDKLTFIAFYADCHHEVKTVKDGYRLALTYNLILENPSKKVGQPKRNNKSLSSAAVIENLCTYFTQKNNADAISSYRRNTPPIWVYLLDHSYTQKGLAWSHLKNGDRLRAAALREAAEVLDLEIHMALADVKETWDCEFSYDNYRSHRYHDEYDDNEEAEADTKDDAQVTDLITSETTLRYWLDREGRPLKYGECYISNHQICWTKASDAFKPFQSEYEGWMGNYGNTMDRWYHRAAIILWRKSDQYAALFSLDSEIVIRELVQLSKKSSQALQIKEIISALLPYWSQHFQPNSAPSLITTTFKLAVDVNDAALAQAMLKVFNMQALTPERTNLFLALQKVYDTSWCLQLFKEWTQQQDHRHSNTACQHISRIIQALSHYPELTDWLLAYQLQQLKDQDIVSNKRDSQAQRLNTAGERIKEAMNFLAACIIADNPALYIKMIEHMIAHDTLYFPLELSETLKTLKQQLKNNDIKKWGYQKLLDHVLNKLKTEHQQGLRKAENWSIQDKTSCTCNDCMVLYQFLQSTHEKTKIWPLGKDRRMHIHQTIDGLGIAVTHKTEHTGSPHKLILTKTGKLHALAKQRFVKIEKVLADLLK
jgi:hypothetical protein